MPEKFKIHTVRGNSNLELQAEADESFLVHGIAIASPANNYATVRVKRSTVAYYRVGGTLGNHLPFRIQDEPNMNLQQWLMKQGIFRPIPVPSGEKLVITGVAQAGAVQTVVYEQRGKDEVKATAPNGPEANDFDYINYGRISTANLADGDNTVSVQQSPSEFPQFPYGDVVPAQSQITVFGVLFSDIGKTTGGAVNQQATNFFRLVKERQTLFDDELNGIPYIATAPGSDQTDIGLGSSLAGNYDTIDERPPLIFPEPLIMASGVEMSVIINSTLSAGAANILPAEVEVGLICRMNRRGA